MGLAASQARLLMLTARKNDLEYRMEIINNRQLALAYQSEAIARDYADDLNDRIMEVRGFDGQGAPINSQITPDVLQISGNMNAVNADGSELNLPSDWTEDRIADFMENGLRNGSIQLVTSDSWNDVHGNGGTGDTSQLEVVDWQGSAAIVDRLYTENDAAAAAKYESDTATINTQERMFELEKRNIESQWKAIETEYDSVKKIIDKNIDRSFKMQG